MKIEKKEIISHKDSFFKFFLVRLRIQMNMEKFNYRQQIWKSIVLQGYY
jgi:hypothetical protein